MKTMMIHLIRLLNWITPHNTEKQMTFYVKDIEFDFVDSEGELPIEFQCGILEDVLGLWTVDDEDSLVDEISDATGFCVKSIDYTPIM